MDIKMRCHWVNNDPLYQAYHDEEWGMPTFDDRRLFESLMLEAMQSGLSWLTILKKRENYRQAFYQFNAYDIVQYLSDSTDKLMQNSGIIRHRLKIEAILNNAKQVVLLEKQGGSFSEFIWSFVGGKPLEVIHNQRSSCAESKQMSKALKKAGFKFVGEVTCYSFMQAVGMVNDHSPECFLHKANE